MPRATQIQLLLDLARTAPAEVTGPLLDAALAEWGWLVRQQCEPLAAALLANPASAEQLLPRLLPHIDPQTEQLVARHPAAPEAVVRRLARSRRVGTVEAVLERASLPEDVLARLARHRHQRTRQRAHAHPALSTSEKIQLTLDGHSHRDWFTADPDYAIWHIREQAERFRQAAAKARDAAGGGGRGETYATPFPNVPTGGLPDDVTALLGEVADVADSYTLGRWFARRPTGEPLAVVLRALEAAGRIGPGANGRLAGQPASDWFVHLTTLTEGWAWDALPRTWADPATVDVAAGLGGMWREAALTHPGCDPRVREGAVRCGTPGERAAVAFNPALTDAEIDVLQRDLPAKMVWRTFRACHDDTRRIRALTSGSGLVSYVLRHDSRVTTPGSKLARGLFTEAVSRAAIAQRDSCAGHLFGELATLLCELHPHLQDEVVAAIRRDDEIPDRLGALLAAAVSARLGADSGAARTFADLFGDWQESVVGLAEAAETTSLAPASRAGTAA